MSGLLTGQVRDQDGNVVADATVYFYAAGTTTPVTTYSDYGLSAGAASSVAVDSVGGFARFVSDGQYKIKITRPGSTDETVDYVTAIEPALYAALAGRSGGQSLRGGTAASERLILQGTNHATQGKILFGFGTGQSMYDEANKRLGVGMADATGSNAPATTLDVSGDAQVIGKADAVQLRVKGHSTQTTNPAVLLVEKSDASDLFGVLNTGVIEAPQVHNAGGTTATGAIVSGTYTPTITGIANVAASTARVCQWIRVGQVVTVSGQCDIDPTATALTSWRITLPVASNIAQVYQVAGCGSQNGGVAFPAVVIQGHVANDGAQMDVIPVDAANRTISFQFLYLVV